MGIYQGKKLHQQKAGKLELEIFDFYLMLLPVENKKHYVVNLSNILFIIHCLKLEPGKEEGVDSNLWVNKRHRKFSGCFPVFVDTATEGRAAALYAQAISRSGCVGSWCDPLRNHHVILSHISVLGALLNEEGMDLQALPQS